MAGLGLAWLRGSRECPCAGRTLPSLAWSPLAKTPTRFLQTQYCGKERQRQVSLGASLGSQPLGVPSWIPRTALPEGSSGAEKPCVSFAFCCNAINATGHPSYLRVTGTSVDIAYAFDGETCDCCTGAVHLIKGIS